MVDFLRQNFPFDKNINEHNMITYLFSPIDICVLIGYLHHLQVTYK